MAEERVKKTHLVTSIRMAAAQAVVWQVITNPELTARCMPGLAEWETVAPQQQFRLVVIWGGSERSSGVRVPVMIEWRDLQPPALMRLHATVYFGSNALQIDGTITLQPQSNGSTVLEFASDLEMPNAMIAGMVQNVITMVLTPFFRCLREEAEARERKT